MIGFWRWVSRRLYDAQEYAATPMKATHVKNIRGRDLESSSLGGDCLRFKVYQAAGGTIIEVNTERAYNDGYIAPSLYVIKEDDDFGVAIKRIITVEALKN